MATSLFLLLFNVILLFSFIDRIISINDPSKLQLSLYPTSGYSVENIEIRCQVFAPTIYENIYLFVRTDNVKPSGILVMADTTVSECRINENKQKYIQVQICNSSLIIIHVNHEITNDSLHTIEYACSQGTMNALSSFRILKEPTVRYQDQKSTNSAATLTCTFLLLLFLLTTFGEVR